MPLIYVSSHSFSTRTRLVRIFVSHHNLTYNDNNSENHVPCQAKGKQSNEFLANANHSALTLYPATQNTQSTHTHTHTVVVLSLRSLCCCPVFCKFTVNKARTDSPRGKDNEREIIQANRLDIPTISFGTFKATLNWERGSICHNVT